MPASKVKGVIRRGDRRGAHCSPKKFTVQWMECTRQCSQWNILNEIAKVKGSQHPSLLLESSWRIGDWTTMKDVLSQVWILWFDFVNPYPIFCRIIDEVEKSS